MICPHGYDWAEPCEHCVREARREFWFVVLVLVVLALFAFR